MAPGKANTDAEGKAQGYSKKGVRYTIRKGDTVLSVADSFGVPADKLRQWNHLSGNSLHVGRALTLYRPVTRRNPRRSGAQPRGKPTGKTRGAGGGGEGQDEDRRRGKVPGKIVIEAGECARDEVPGKVHGEVRRQADRQRASPGREKAAANDGGQNGAKDVHKAAHKG